MGATLQPGAGMTGRLHPDLEPLAFVLGTWTGEGAGTWPGSAPFAYGEEVVVEDIGDTFLVFAERSWSLDDGTPIHLERGFLRGAGATGVELVLAHPIGVTEVGEGSIGSNVIEVASTAIGLTATASSVTELRRRIEVRGDDLTYELWMATREVEQISHVRSRLRRA